MSWRINLKQMEAFRAVMLSGTTTRAAGILNVSQPAVSRSIQDFERQLGVRLFVRRQGRLHPTPEADLLFREAEETLSRLDRLNTSVRDLRLLERGQLRLIASSPMAYGLLPQALARFRESNSDVSVSLQITLRREARHWVNDQRYDLAVTSLPLDYPVAEIEPLARVKGVCVLPPEHPLTAREVIHASDLDGEPFVSLVPETLARFRLDRVFERVGVRRNMAVEAQTPISVCVLVMAGIGVAITDPFSARVFEGRGIVIRPFEPAFEYEYGILFPLRRPRSQLAEAFASITRECASDFVPA